MKRIYFSILILLIFVSPVFSGVTEQIHNDSALVNYYQGDYAKAVEGFKKAISMNANYTEAHFNLGRAYYKMRNYKEAIISLQTAVRLNNKYRAAIKLLSRIKKEFEKKQKEDAKSGSKFRVNISPELSFPWDDFSEAFYAYYRGEVQVSKNLFSAIEKNNPKDPKPFMEKGIIYYELKMYSDAVYYFNEAIKIAPDNVHAYYNLGLAYEMNNDRDAATHYYRLAVSMNNSLIKASERLSSLQSNLSTDYYTMAQRAYEKREWEKALILIDKALKNTLPGTPEYKKMKNLYSLSQSMVREMKNKKINIRKSFLADEYNYDDVYDKGLIRHRDSKLIWTGKIHEIYERNGQTILQMIYSGDFITENTSTNPLLTQKLDNTSDSPFNTEIDARNPNKRFFQIHCGRILERDEKLNEESIVEVHGQLIGVEAMINGYQYGISSQIPVIKAFKLSITSKTSSGTLIIEPLN